MNLNCNPAIARRLLCVLVLILGANYISGQTPSATNNASGDEFVNEQFCFPVELMNTGPNAGYGPYFRLILPPGVTFNAANPVVGSATVTVVGTFAGVPLKDPVLDTETAIDSVTGPVGHTLIIVQLPIGSITTGGITPEIEVCVTMDPNIVTIGTPVPIDVVPVYEFGDTPTGANGPIVGAPSTGMVTPVLYTYEKYSDAPKQDRTPGPSWPITYTLEVDIADAQSITNLVFDDVLPGTLQWTGAPVTVSGGSGCTVTASPNLPPTPGGTIQVTCPSATGALGPGDVLVNFEAYVIDTLDETIGDGGACDTEEIINNSDFDAAEGALVSDADTVTAY
ncbi:MAG: hypothetical protein AAF570_21830, partial [Bacteroidota bacterium]